MRTESLSGSHTKGGIPYFSPSRYDAEPHAPFFPSTDIISHHLSQTGVKAEGELNTLCPYSRLILEDLSSAILIVQTGVEVAGELTDFIKEDLMRRYPQRAQAMR